MIEPNLYEIGNIPEQKFGTDRFFGIKVQRENCYPLPCLFKPISKDTVRRILDLSNSKESIICEVGQLRETDRVYVPQFFLRCRTAMWVAMVILSLVAGVILIFLYKGEHWKMRTRIMVFPVIAALCFTAIFIIKSWIGFAAYSFTGSMTQGSIPDAGGACFDNSSSDMVRIYVGGYQDILIPAHQHYVVYSKGSRKVG
jgi:hypothetical protein